MAASVRHETRALLRAHLSAASSYGHLTPRCPICHHLLRLAMDAAPQAEEATAPAEEIAAAPAGGNGAEAGASEGGAPAAAP